MGPNLVDTKSWATQKHTHGLDFPNLPFYKDEHVTLTQSMAILQHIGRKYKLAGDNLKEQGTLDMVAETVNDLRWQAWVVYNDPNFHDIKEDWKSTIPERLSDLNRFLENKDFVLGSKISYVDFLVYESVEWYRAWAPEIFKEKLASIESFQNRVECLPTIKSYMNSDKFKSWPFFAPILHFGYSRVSYRTFKKNSFGAVINAKC